VATLGGAVPVVTGGASRPTLAERIDAGVRAPAALLLVGAAPAALAREAFSAAAALLCPGGDPERACGACRRVAEGLHPDLFLVAPEGVQIRVDRVREAIAFAAGRPYEAPRRVVVVARAELLGTEAGNALLKNLEEPGAHVHWILTTTQPEALLPTIRSRCAVERVAPPSAAERLAGWRRRGFAEADAADLSVLERHGEEADAEELAEFRDRRERVLDALDAGLSSGKLAPLVLLAEQLGKAEASRADVLAEVLADAAAIGAVSPDLLRHRGAAGKIQRLGQRAPRESLGRAAVKAADAPRDNRRGNRRLHFESVLLALFAARRPRSGQP
jgi:DNA polymerase-3 subunit delta'